MSRAAEYYACAAEGLTQRETAERLGVKPGTVSEWARRHGVKFAAGQRGRPRDDRFARLPELAASGMTARQMAEELRVPVRSVRHALEIRGIRLRDYRRREAAE